MPEETETSSRKPLLLLLAILLVAASGGAYLYFSAAPPKAIETDQPAPPPPELAEASLPPSQADQQLGSQSPPLTSSQETPEEKLEQPAPMAVKLDENCLATIEEMDNFFTYLDRQDYIKKYQLPGGSKKYVAQQIYKLLHSPPAIQNGAGTTMGTISNHAHLFRTMGGQNLAIIRAIIEKEPDRLEEVSAAAYRWLTLSPKCPNHFFTISPQMAEIYPYANFFLNSAGGQAYLRRRNEPVRLLATYYALLVARQSNQAGLAATSQANAQTLAKLISDLESSTELSHRDEYLANLYKMRKHVVAP
ncbi:MAG: hypothetical protein ABFR97_03560 [Thermodesulfobacteriota bacterium]